MPEVSLLFTPTLLGAVDIPNRVLMAPLTRSRAQRDGVPGPLAPLYYAQRASAGLIVTEATQVTPEGQGYISTPGIHSAAQVAGWRRVTDATHAAGGRIFLQLWHVGRVSHESFQPGGALPVAPSAIALPGDAWTYDGMKPHPTPRALETDEIAGVVAKYRHGAELAREAGFDGVEVHGANGYLIDQFLRDGTNRRTDRYGGSAANRARFLLEVTEAVVAVWGAERVGVRLSPLGGFNGMSDSDPAVTFGEAVEALGGFGLAYLHMVEQFGPEKLSEAQLDVLRRIRDRGISIVVDDFGTGYSSLQYVQRFPIDILKIDRSFVTGLGTNPGDGAVVQSMIELSQRLGVHTVAEGIDRPEQVTLLQSLGADLGQGYLFSKPVVADQITALLDASPHENPKFLLH